MMTLKNTIVLLTLFFTSALFAQEAPDTKDESDRQTVSNEMTQQRMVEIIKEISTDGSGPNNNFSFKFQGVDMILVSDNNADRMRLLTGIVEASKMSEQQMMATLVSNFHLALDARYAISNGILFSTFIHPLSPLTERQLVSAIRQVSTLATTFGTTYTSGEMTFGGQSEEAQVNDEIDI